MSRFSMDNLEKALHKLPTQLHNLKEAAAYTINPNRRHDEKWEMAIDQIRTEIAESHRFTSFAPERSNNLIAPPYICGHDYFYAVSELLESAKESVFIMGWWLSPELHLRRPPSQNEQYRLDRLLLKKANEGVKIHILIYKEVAAALSLSSEHTKHELEALHENIMVMRHPDHSGGDITLAWAHHQKLVIVDNLVAGMGGLDLSYGRWDTRNAVLADVHPTDFSRTLFAGQDYNNARIQDFKDVSQWASNQPDKLNLARMPWQDISVMFTGSAVLDLVQHFVERWNFIKTLKYKHNSNYYLLAFPHVVGSQEDLAQSIVRHPHYEAFKRAGKQFLFHSIPPSQGGSPLGGLNTTPGRTRLQILRSQSDWSAGTLTEHSIMNAYIQMIYEANHYIYIENQFFITATHSGGAVQNQIGKALVERILSAARSHKKFKVVIVLPAIPGFAGDLEGDSSLTVIMGQTYKSLCRGPNSIMELIRAAGYDPKEYISVFALRSYDRINNDPARLQMMQNNSGGISFYQAEAALTRVHLGQDATDAELDNNATCTFALATEGGEKAMKLKKSEAKSTPSLTLDVPRDYHQALQIIQRFQSGDDIDESISDSVAHHAMLGTGSLFDERWSGTEESELAAYVNEELYIHTKMMIVDDLRVIIGSANLNDRSQLGQRDSELAVVIEDQEDMIKSTMDGKPFMASSFASKLRRSLYKQHLGLLPPQFCPNEGEESPTPAMRAVGSIRPIDEPMTTEDALVADPLADSTIKLWQSTADQNTVSYEKVFHCVPSDRVHDWAQYKAYLPQVANVGHVHEDNTDLYLVKQELDKVRGHLVNYSLDFLKDVDLLAISETVNPLTMAIYI